MIVGDALRWVFLCPLAQVFPTEGVGAEPGLVVQPFGEEDMHQAQGEGAIGGGTRADVLVGADGGQGAARVDDDDVGAVALGLAQERHPVGRGAGGIVAPDEDELALADSIGVGREASSEREVDRHLGGGAADGPLQAAGAHPIPEPGVADAELDQAEGAAVGVREDGGGAVLLDDPLPASCDLRRSRRPR